MYMQTTPARFEIVLLLSLACLISFLLHLLSQTTPNYQVISQQTFVPQAVSQQHLVPKAESGRAFLHPIFFSTVLTLPLSFLILPSLFQLVPCQFFFLFLSDFSFALTKPFLSLPQLFSPLLIFADFKNFIAELFLPLRLLLRRHILSIFFPIHLSFNGSFRILHKHFYILLSAVISAVLLLFCTFFC